MATFRFTAGPWNVHEGNETFGPGHRKSIPLEEKMKKYAEIGLAGMQFHDDDAVPDMNNMTEKQIIDYAKKPFIIKGVMTVRGALKALEAGASGIVVSNHGGRVQDQCPSTAEVLPAIADAVGGKLTILVDGGLRNGTDIFKALAMGADGVLIGRPFVTMVYGGGSEGPAVLVNKLQAELADTMAMCGAHNLAEIRRDMLFGY